MSPTQARAFNAVAREGSFTAAARALNVSQPTVTTQVKELEAYYGVELFHRHGRGVHLTETGRRLLTIVQRMYAHQQEAIEFLQAVKGLEIGHLQIGSYAPFHLTEILAEFHHRYPGVRISVRFENSRQLRDDVLNYIVDVAVLSSDHEHPELHTVHYRRPKLVLVVGKQHPWAGRRSVSIKDLDRQVMVRREEGSEAQRAFDLALSAAGVQPDFVMELGSREGILAAAAQGIGIGFISEEGIIPENAVTKLRLSDVVIDTRVAVVCLAERREARVIRAFLDVVDELVVDTA